jgi:hypothetical protein
MVYILNPRNGLWAAVDLLETGASSGTFVSTICVDLISIEGGCMIPSLRVIPGDTILAAYTDPSNPSDTVWISAKVTRGLP